MCVKINQRQRIERHKKCRKLFYFALYFRLVVILSIAHSKKTPSMHGIYFENTLLFGWKFESTLWNVKQNEKIISNNTSKREKETKIKCK